MENKDLNPTDVNYVIYHAPCHDGTGSAFVVWLYMKKYFPNRNIVYYPAKYGKQPTNIDGKNVLILDFSYRNNILKNMIIKTNKILVIDHHKSAEKDLSDIDNKYKIFNMDHSATILTWKFFFKNKEAPLLLQYIEDRDIWKKELTYTDEFASWFYTKPLEFNIFNKYLDNNKLLNKIEQKGTQYNKLNKYYIKKAIKYISLKFMKINNKYYLIAYINSTILKSDIGNYIFTKYPLIDFSATYSINDLNNNTSFSLRSTNNHSDVSKIAFELNGGGHRNAAGIQINNITNTLPGIHYTVNMCNILDKIYFETVEIDDFNFNIVYLNSAIYKKELGMYLLQDKYTTTDNISIQTATTVYYYIKNINPNEITTEIRINIAAIWDYNGVIDKTEFNILFDQELSKNSITILKKWLILNEKNIIIYDGIQKTLE